MKSGPPICALRASARPIGDSGFIGWPSPVAQQVNGTPLSDVNMVAQLSLLAWQTPKAHDGEWASPRTSGRPIEKSTHLQTQAAAVLKGWATPNTMDHLASSNLSARKTKGGCANLKDQVEQLRGWATLRARDHKNNGVSIARAAKGVADSLDLQCKLVCRSGTDPQSLLDARMDRGAYVLNPAHSLWLMGYPSEWENFAEPATASSHNSPPCSSKPQ
jgi:hypothetical protein